MNNLIFYMILFKIIFTQNDFSKFIEDEFKKYLKKFNKTYLTKQEYLIHLNLFNSSFNKVINHNKNNSFKISLNKFSDLTKEEKKKYKKGNIIKHEGKLNKKFPFVITIGGIDDSDKDIDKEKMDLPKNFDYRELGGITEVSSQGICGSCAVFSIVSLIEHYYFMKENELKKFSEQQIIDCASDSDICSSGSSGWDILQYIEKNGIMEYENYPYISGDTGRKSKCRYKEKDVVTKISGYRMVNNPKPINIKKYLYKYGPISAAINSDCIEDYYYGIVDYSSSKCGNSLDDVSHAVTIVGWDYDEETQTDYWIVRNSWGIDWGNEGYMYVKYGKNTLGIENQIYFVSSNFIKIYKILFYFILMILF